MLVEGCFVNDFPVDRFLKDENITLALDRLRPGYAKSSANICLDVSHMEQSIVQEALARAVHTISSKVSRQPLAVLAIQVHESEARMGPCAITACACIWQGSKDRAGEACTVPLRGTMLPEHLSTMSTASSGPRLVHSSDMGKLIFEFVEKDCTDLLKECGATVVGVATDNQILADAFASRSPSQLIVMSFSDTLKETLIQKLNDPSTSLFRGICLIGDFLENELVLPEIERASIFILNYFGWLRRFDPPAYQDTDEWIRENASGIATDIQRFNDRRVADGIPAVPLDAGASTLVDYFNRDGEHADISVPLMKKMTAFQYWRQKHSSDAFAKYIFWSTICPCNVDEARHIFRGSVDLLNSFLSPVTPEKTFCRGLIRWKLDSK
ncbi:hypothetical protein FOL47_008372 [Perkinsus chesapeaki]|uniref:Uncharacterized protein n=1 Tax=Perkinsus chesapeaki TaxID=330153 RepID=A0A7J6LEG9_PERCH|nr:hypothetical protein FOL47_008372 [Perkinsus chesapeaki]